MEEKEPYKLPDGWKWVKLGEIGKWGSGGTPSRTNPDYYDGDIKWIKTGELNDNVIFDSEEKISELGLKNSSAKLFPKGTLLIAMYGATIGKTAILGVEASTNQACAGLIVNDKIISSNEYVYYFLKSQKQSFIDLGKGGAQPNISQTVLKEYFFPLPPLEEQQRIANILDNLTSKLAEAKELINEARETFEKRRMAILHKAFTGELTKSWREENRELLEKEDYAHIEEVGENERPYELPDGWKWVRLGDCFNLVNEKREPDENSTENYIGLEHLKKGGGILDIGSSEELKSTKTVFQNGDILYGKLRPYLDKHWVADINGVCSTDILVFRSNGTSIGKILDFYFALPNIIQYAVENSTGINLPRVAPKKMLELAFPLPPLAEQKEIVRILENLLSKEEEAKALTDLEEQIELMEKSILSKAFRGEL